MYGGWRQTYAQWACVENCQLSHSAILGGMSYGEQCTAIDPKQGDCGPQGQNSCIRTSKNWKRLSLGSPQSLPVTLGWLLHAAPRTFFQYLLLLHQNIQRSLKITVMSALASNTNKKLVLHSNGGVMFALLAPPPPFWYYNEMPESMYFIKKRGYLGSKYKAQGSGAALVMVLLKESSGDAGPSSSK